MPTQKDDEGAVLIGGAAVQALKSPWKYVVGDCDAVVVNAAANLQMGMMPAPIGANDAVVASQDGSLWPVIRHVAKVVHAQRGALGTGVIVAGGVLLTNRHVIESAQAAHQAYAEVSGGPYLPVHYPLDAAHYVTGATLDLAIVPLSLPHNGAGLPSGLPLHVSPPEVGDHVSILHYPGGGPLMESTTNNLVKGVYPSRLVYTADTDSGSSGAPVFNEYWQLIAIHREGQPGRGNIGIPSQAILDDLRSALALASHTTKARIHHLTGAVE